MAWSAWDGYVGLARHGWLGAALRGGLGTAWHGSVKPKKNLVVWSCGVRPMMFWAGET